MTARGTGFFFFCGDENVLKLMEVMLTQFCGYSKNHVLYTSSG